MKKNLLLLLCAIVFASCEKEDVKSKEGDGSVKETMNSSIVLKTKIQHIGAGEEAEMLEKQYGVAKGDTKSASEEVEAGDGNNDIDFTDPTKPQFGGAVGGAK